MRRTRTLTGADSSFDLRKHRYFTGTADTLLRESQKVKLLFKFRIRGHADTCIDRLHWASWSRSFSSDFPDLAFRHDSNLGCG